MSSQALVPSLLAKNSTRLWEQALVVLGGLLALTVHANLQIHLPFTPVPITGQTFGVTLLALLFGRKLSAVTVVSYVGLGLLGVPMLAVASGVTVGYLFGMVVSALVIGTLSDRGWTNSFGKAWVASVLGSVCVLSIGALVLAYFIPANQVFALGVLPFLPGDALKDVAAASIATASRRLASRNHAV